MHFTLYRLFITALLFLSTSVSAKTISETIIFLEPDGENYLMQRSLHTRHSGHRFHVEKSVKRNDLRHVSPKKFQWDTRDPLVNTLTFNSNGFTLIYPGKFPESQLSKNSSGAYHYKSWDGYTDPDGHFGFWFAPDDYDSFIYSWVFPTGTRILDYKSNRRGSWVQRGNAVTFYGDNVNNLTFEVRYRMPEPRVDKQSVEAKPIIKEVIKVVEVPVVKEVIKYIEKPVTEVKETVQKQPKIEIREVEVIKEVPTIEIREVEVIKEVPTVEVREVIKRVEVPVVEIKEVIKVVEVPTVEIKEVIKYVEVPAEQLPIIDNDNDGVADADDACPSTPEKAIVTLDGCALDYDSDGVINQRDRCPGTIPTLAVDEYGCPADNHNDTDKDKVGDDFDLCPKTPFGAYVDRVGCSLDTDKDEVADGIDLCIATPEETKVDANGCTVHTIDDSR